jgi:hypothetical protein
VKCKSARSCQDKILSFLGFEFPPDTISTLVNKVRIINLLSHRKFKTLSSINTRKVGRHWSLARTFSSRLKHTARYRNNKGDYKNSTKTMALPNHSCALCAATLPIISVIGMFNEFTMAG